MNRLTWILLLLVLLFPWAGQAQDAAAPAPAPAPPALVDIRQVQIQVFISEVSENGLRELGANLDFTRFVRGIEENGSVPRITSRLIDTVNDFGRVTLPDPRSPLVTGKASPLGAPLRAPNDESGLQGIQTRQGAGLEFSIIDTGYGTIDGVFRAIEGKTDVDLISKPEILVANGLPATIKAGGQVPYQALTYPKGAPALQVAWRDIGVNMVVTPTALPNDYVKLSLATLEVSDINRIENLRGVDLPVFSKRSQTGDVYVPNGESLVIGGLSSQVIRKSERRIPVLGKLPLIGLPFRHRQSEAHKRTLLIFVTPTVVDLRNMNDTSNSALHFWQKRANDWSQGERIEKEVQVME